MFFSIPVAFLAMVVAVSAIPAPTTPCAAVHVITTRASTEAPGEGIIGDVVDRIVAGTSKGVSREATVYPALLSPYATSQAAGVAALKRLLAAKASACPNTQIVLTGYSQGAHVSGDVLADNAPGSDKVVAVILMGDPGHVRLEPFQKGTANLLNGLFPRRSGALNAYSSKIVSYCDIGDPFCAGGLSTITHLAYVTVYGIAAARFVGGIIG